MKKKLTEAYIIISIIIIACGHDLRCQVVQPWYTPSWDWTVDSSSNWIAKTSTGAISTIASPFQGNPSSTDLQNIISAEDFKPKQGWVLLFKDFGYVDLQNPTNSIDVDSDMPLFLLYNKYTGTIRGFFHAPNIQNFSHTGAVAKISWAIPNSPTLNGSLLTLANSYPQSNTDYPKPVNTDAFFNYLQDYPTAAGWFTTEFKCNFDPTTNPNTYGQKIVIKFILSSSSKVAVEGSYTFTTQSASAIGANQQGVPNSTGNVPLEDFLVQSKKFLGKMPTKSDLENVFTTIENAVNTVDGKYCNNFTRDLHNMNNSLQNGALKSFLIGAAGFIPYVGTGLNMLSTVLDLFSNKSNAATVATDALSVQPTISEGHITLTGSITTQASGKSLFLQVPGTKHKNGSNQINYTGLPYYDCPLGVISLKQIPNVKKRLYNITSVATQSVKSQVIIASNFVNIGNPQAQSTFSEVITVAANGNTVITRSNFCINTSTTSIVSYKLDDILQLDHNLASGTTVTSAKVALAFEILPDTGQIGIFQGLNGLPTIVPTDTHLLTYDPFINSCSATDLFPEYTYLTGPTTNTIVSSSDDYVNITRKNLDANILKLCYYDPINKLHKFQTQFVDLDKARNLSATFQDGRVKVYLKILVVLKPNILMHDQTPIVNEFTYEVTNFTADNSAGTPFSPICNQLVEIEDDSYLATQVCNSTGQNIISGNTNGVLITNICGVWLQPGINVQNSTSIWKADNLIRMKAPFKTVISGLDKFNAQINPTGSCTSGMNALQINDHFANCNSNPQTNKATSPDAPVFELEPNEVADKLDDATLNMVIAPNPTDGSFQLIFSGFECVGKVTITDYLNRIIWDGSVDTRNTVNLDFVEIDRGAYLIKFFDGKRTPIVRKLIVR